MIMLCIFKSDHNLFTKVYILKYFQIEKQNNYLFLNKKKMKSVANISEVVTMFIV